jgi:hypothetical protein
MDSVVVGGLEAARSEVGGGVPPWASLGAGPNGIIIYVGGFIRLLCGAFHLERGCLV